MLKKLIFSILFVGLGVSLVCADDTIETTAIGPFKGLNTNQSQEAIDASQSPDLMNVDIANGYTSVKKRQGYGTDVTLTVSTSAVHNLYKFFDSSGNEVRLAFNDNRVNASVNGAAWSVILTTGITVGATWDCTDYLGFAYCVSSAFDCPIKTNGTSAGTTGVCGTNGVPQGSLIASTADRLLVGSTSANPSRLYYSQSTVLTNFALGVQPSDSSFEDITAPGSKLTHLSYHFGKWLWWKDQSFGFLIGTSQFDLQNVTISNTIGTLDNTDIFDGNYLYFRGSDSQIYTYDGSTLSRAISHDIGPTLRSANRRKSNFWTQTTQSDFQAGSIVPTNQLSTTISPGSVIVSSFQVNEYSAASGWSSGSSSNFAIGASSISLLTNNSGTVTNPDFESSFSGNWSNSGSANTPFAQNIGSSLNCGVINPQTGSDDARGARSLTGTPSAFFEAVDLNSTLIQQQSVSVGNICSWAQASLTPSSSNIGKRVKFRLHLSDAGGDAYLTTSDSYIWGGAISFYYNSGCTGNGVCSVNTNYIFFDNITLGSSTITSGSFTSQKYDTGFTSSTYQISDFTYTVNTSTPTFSLLTASNSTTGPWTTLLTSTGTNAVGNRYAQFVSTISIGSTDNALTYISSFTIISRSSGTYYSAVNNAPNLTSFSTIGITDSIMGNSAITYYTRASTNVFTVLSSTPSWTAQTKNATVSTSSGTYMQLRADFAITAATETPSLSDFTFNWFEGSAADKMYGTYFNNGLWFSVSLGTTTTTNNRILRYDLLSSVWTLYDIASNGFLIYGNNLYFGDPAVGKVYQFGNNVYSDNGSNITAYWKSKPFFGSSPFQEKDMRTGSWYVASDSGTTLTVTYTIDETTTTITKDINLYDPNRGIIRNNYNFPSGTTSTVYSAKVGDSSTNPPWEVFGGLITYVAFPWVVTP